MRDQNTFLIEKYQDYVNDFIKKSEERDKVVSCNELRLFDLPDARWFINNCPDKTIDTWAKFTYWCGFFSPKATSKEHAIELIYRKQRLHNTPLKYDDFRHAGCYDVQIPYIRRIWGTINKMKEELGLEIIQESMIDKIMSRDDFIDETNRLFNYLHSIDIDFITRRMLNSIKEFHNYDTFDKYCKRYFRISFNDYIINHGFRIGKMGSGIVSEFDDGEIAKSQFEYIFSSYLRSYGLRYNQDYFREVKYSTFISDYDGLMDCDYVIKYNDNTIYIEIAGIIDAYKTFFIDNKVIKNRKSREKYRKKLMHKKEMLLSNHLLYFILFPCDLTKENLKEILENPTEELRSRIELFVKNNIDWTKIRENGELKYNEEIKWGRNVIDYD